MNKNTILEHCDSCVDSCDFRENIRRYLTSKKKINWISKRSSDTTTLVPGSSLSFETGSEEEDLDSAGCKPTPTCDKKH